MKIKRKKQTKRSKRKVIILTDKPGLLEPIANAIENQGIVKRVLLAKSLSQALSFVPKKGPYIFITDPENLAHVRKVDNQNPNMKRILLSLGSHNLSEHLFDANIDYSKEGSHEVLMGKVKEFARV